MEFVKMKMKVDAFFSLWSCRLRKKLVNQENLANTKVREATTDGQTDGR